MLSREMILGTAAPVVTKEVAIPEWKGSIHIRMLSCGEFMKLADKGKDDADHAIYHWVIATVCDDKGVPLFSDADLPALEAQPFAVLREISDTAMALNIRTEDDKAKN